LNEHLKTNQTLPNYNSLSLLNKVSLNDDSSLFANQTQQKTVDVGNKTIKNVVFKQNQLTENNLAADSSNINDEKNNTNLDKEIEKSNQYIKNLISSIKMDVRNEKAAATPVAQIVSATAALPPSYRTINENKNNGLNTDNFGRMASITANNEQMNLLQEYERELKRQDLNTMDFSLTSSLNFEEKDRPDKTQTIGSLLVNGAQIFDEKPKASSTIKLSNELANDVK
jgi:hypothetical protein